MEKQYIAIIQINRKYGENYWVKSRPEESLEKFKERVNSCWDYSQHHISFHELGPMI